MLRRRCPPRASGQAGKPATKHAPKAITKCGKDLAGSMMKLKEMDRFGRWLLISGVSVWIAWCAFPAFVLGLDMHTAGGFLHGTASLLLVLYKSLSGRETTSL